MKLTDGYTKLPNKIWLSDKIGRNEKALLTVLLVYTMQKKECFPSRELLMEKTGLAKNTFRQTLKNLKKRRFVFVEKRGRHNFYKINF